MNNMAYENNNVKAGANGVGVYVGSTEIMGGGTNIIPVDLDANSASVDVLLANLTDAVATFRFYRDTTLNDFAVCQPFEVRCISSFSSVVNQINVSCGDNSEKYYINSSIHKISSCKDNNGDVETPEFTLVDNAGKYFANGRSYDSNTWDYITQSTDIKESFGGGWILLTMGLK